MTAEQFHHLALLFRNASDQFRKTAILIEAGAPDKDPIRLGCNNAVLAMNDLKEVIPLFADIQLSR